jgi:hypothetical protein
VPVVGLGVAEEAVGGGQFVARARLEVELETIFGQRDQDVVAVGFVLIISTPLHSGYSQPDSLIVILWHIPVFQTP